MRQRHQTALAILALVLAWLGSLSPVLAQQRIALVIGADRYQHLPPLTNATSDARAVAARLAGLGYDTLGGPVLDPTGWRLQEALARFEDRIQGAEVALFFYAGHAVEIGGENLLLPVDAQPANSARLIRASAVPLAEILSQMTARARHAILLIDACRDNPLPRDAVRSLGAASRGLARIEAPSSGQGSGSFVVFAAQPGRTALDRLPGADPDPNGLFTRHLLRALANPSRPLNGLMSEVRDHVAAAAQAVGREQVPHIDDRMIGSGQFMLAGGVIPPPPVAPPVFAPPPAVSPEALDLAFWQSIQNSRNLADYEAYLARFPRGQFVQLARNRISELTPRPAPSFPAAMPRPHPPAGGSLVAAARDFALRYYGTFSQDDATAMAFIHEAYAPSVDFHGTPRAPSFIAPFKLQFLQRWPVRHYVVRQDSLDIRCDAASAICTVFGLVDWDARSPARAAVSQGLADFTLRISFATGRGPLILAEASNVVSRGGTGR